MSTYSWLKAIHREFSKLKKIIELKYLDMNQRVSIRAIINFIETKTFTIKAINLAGVESPALSYTVTVPQPEFPSGAELE